MNSDTAKATVVQAGGIILGLTLHDISLIAATISYLVAAAYGLFKLWQAVRSKKETE